MFLTTMTRHKVLFFENVLLDVLLCCSVGQVTMVELEIIRIAIIDLS